MNKYIILVFALCCTYTVSIAQPSNSQLKEIILAKTENVIPESITLSSTGGTPMKQINGLIHWKRSATFIGNSSVGRKKYYLDIHVDHAYNFIKFTWGDVEYLDLEMPDFGEIEIVIRKLKKKFIGGLDGKIRKVNSIEFLTNEPGSITWGGGSKEIDLVFKVTFIADGRYNYEERWLASQIYTVRFFKQSPEDVSFLDRIYILNRRKRTDLKLKEKIDKQEAKKVR